MTFHHNDYREIITKAVCGRGSKLVKSMNYVTPSNRPSSVLGCWVINHIYQAKKHCDDIVKVEGSYDINIWYSFNDNTRTEVATETVNYCDDITLSTKDKDCFHDNEVFAKVLKQPNCLQCKIDKKGNKILVEVEREFEVKIIGETKVNVKVEPIQQSIDYHCKISDGSNNNQAKFVKGN